MSLLGNRWGAIGLYWGYICYRLLAFFMVLLPDQLRHQCLPGRSVGGVDDLQGRAHRSRQEALDGFWSGSKKAAGKATSPAPPQLGSGGRRAFQSVACS